MASFTRADPSDRDAFDDHYERIRNDPAVILRAIDDGSGLVGTIGSFTTFLDVELTRPLFARVAVHTLASAKVLDRAGFVKIGSEVSFADDPGRDVIEHIYQLAQ